MAALLSNAVCEEYWTDAGVRETPLHDEYVAAVTPVGLFISNFTPHPEECPQCQE